MIFRDFVQFIFGSVNSHFGSFYINSAGIVIDAIRCCKLALEREKGGILYSPSAYFMKHPPKQFTDDEAYKMTEEFIEGKREN